MSGHLGELLSAFLDGESSLDEQARIAEHLDRCGRCRVELDALAAARAAVRSLPVLEVPDSVFSLGRPEAQPRRWIRIWMGSAAAVVAVVVGVATLVAPPEPAPLPPSELPAAFMARSAAASSFNPTKAMLPAPPAGEPGR